MPVRAPLIDLIPRLRILIADPTAASFTDQAMQDALDRTRQGAHHWPLRAEPTMSAGGTWVYLDYYATWPVARAGQLPGWLLALRPGGIVVPPSGPPPPPVGDWDTSAVLQDAAGTVLTPATSDLVSGYWTFSTDPGGLVYLTGATYDLYAAAADLLDAWAAQTKLAYDYSQNGQQFVRSQQTKAILTLAATYRRKRRPRHTRWERSDLTAGRV